MPRFRCNNPECSNTKVELIPRVKFTWNNDTQRLEAPEATCPFCGCQRYNIQDEGPIKIPWFKAENAKNYQNKNVEKRVKRYNY